MTDWKLGQYVRVWRSQFHGDDGGYEYGHIETMEYAVPDLPDTPIPEDETEVMLVGDDGKEIYTTVKELEEGE